MRPNPYPSRRDSLRWDCWDYEEPVSYFLTICAHERRCIFSRVEGDDVVLNPMGLAVVDCWRSLPDRFDQVVVEDSVMMPNHFHGILRVRRHYLVHLGRIVGTFKGISAGAVNVIRGTRGARVWQRGYFDRVIRDARELERARRYVVENPMRWTFDRLNPERR